MHMSEAVEEFVADLRLAGRSERTVHGHELELQRLERWLHERGQRWETLTRRELQPYVRERAELGHSSRANMLCSLRTFYRWCVEQEYVALSPAAGFKTPTRPRPVPRSLSREQVRALVAALATAEGRTARRDEVLFLTGIYAGMRAKELASLVWPNVDLSECVIVIPITKMNHGRTLPIHTELRDMLANWRELQGQGGRGPVFSLDGKPINANRVGKIARKWAERAGVRFTAHMLRHTFATQALRRSRDLYSVSKALGHLDLKQTEVYLSADPEQLRGAVDSLPGLASW